MILRTFPMYSPVKELDYDDSNNTLRVRVEDDYGNETVYRFLSVPYQVYEKMSVHHTPFAFLETVCMKQFRYGEIVG